MKRRFQYDNNDDDYSDISSSEYCRSTKRFLSEEMMSSHMEQLYLTTPPHNSPTPTDNLSEPDDDWPTSPPCECSGDEEIVLMDSNSEDSSDDDKTSVHVWIAPEMKHIMSNNPLSQSVVPDKLLDDMRNKPCQALVPFIAPEVSLSRSVWKDCVANQSISRQQLDTLTSSTTNHSPLLCDNIPPKLCESLNDILDRQINNNNSDNNSDNDDDDSNMEL